ncbi:MAG: ATP synthase subunit I [Terriglobia bacterium]
MQAIEETTGQIERRLLRWMIALGAAATLAAVAIWRVKFAAGVATGGAIAILGYVWLLDALSAALAGETARLTKGLAIKLVIRYPILLGALYLFYRTKWLPVEAVLAGLFVPLAGGVVECLYQAGGMAFQSRWR